MKKKSPGFIMEPVTTHFCVLSTFAEDSSIISLVCCVLVHWTKFGVICIFITVFTGVRNLKTRFHAFKS